MIEQLEVANYRSLRKVSLKPQPITCLIGANGSGKSNVLEALELLRAAAGEELAAFINQRQGFPALRWFGAEGHDVSFKLRLRAPGGAGPAALRYELTLGTSGASYVVAEEYLRPARAAAATPAEYVRNVGGQGRLFNEERHAFDKVPARDEPGPGPRETFLGHFRAARYYGTVNRAREALRQWSVLSFARIDTRPGAPIRSPRGLGDSPALEQDGRNLTDVLAYLQEQQPRVLAEIERVTRAAFREIRRLSARPVPGTGMWVTRASVAGAAEDVPIWNLSDGVIRFLCLAVGLLAPVPSRLLILDEPEVGMHPALAPNVVELFRAAVAGRQRQVLVATHSADIVDQLEAPEVVVVDKATHSGETRLRPLRADRDLRGWIKAYRLGELWREGHLGGRP